MALPRKPKRNPSPELRYALRKLLEDLDHLKPIQRIAIQLVQAGYAEHEVANAIHHHDLRNLPCPLTVDLQNSVRDVLRGFIPLTIRNKTLAERI